MSEKAPGFEEYTPSRLEWLTTLLNSIIQFVDSSESSINYLFLPGDNGKTIALYVKYPSNMDQEQVENAADKVNELAITMARSYKWESWLDIEVKFDPIDK